MGWESACSKVTDDCACAGPPELARQGLRGQVNAWDEVWCSHFCCHYPTAFVPLSATVHCLATMSTLCTHAAVRWANYSAGRLGNWTGPRMFPISESGVDGERCHCTVPSVAASQSLSCLWHSSGCDQGIGFISASIDRLSMPGEWAVFALSDGAVLLTSGSGRAFRTVDGTISKARGAIHPAVSAWAFRQPQRSVQRLDGSEHGSRAVILKRDNAARSYKGRCADVRLRVLLENFFSKG